MRKLIETATELQIRAAPISKDEFAPFGNLIDIVPSGDRTDMIGGIENRQTNAKFHLSTIRIAPSVLPLTITMMERHSFSSQSFLPLDAARYLLCVAESGRDGWPDMKTLRSFIVPSGVGVTYRAGTWHHPMVTLDDAASFAIMMWCGDDANEEFVDLENPVTVTATI
jgi:ureidoglycolate lyase